MLVPPAALLRAGGNRCILEGGPGGLIAFSPPTRGQITFALGRHYRRLACRLPCLYARGRDG